MSTAPSTQSNFPQNACSPVLSLRSSLADGQSRLGHPALSSHFTPQSNLNSATSSPQSTPTPTRNSSFSYEELPHNLQHPPAFPESTPPPTLPENQPKKVRVFARHVWLPYTLRWPYLAGVVALSLTLLFAIIYVDQKSLSSHGLIDNNSSAVVLFLFKYIPTFVAVLYTLLISILLEDVKRTEPYARLANPRGAYGDTTVVRKPGSLWNILVEGICDRKREGSFGWPLILSAIGTILVLFIVSPLSAILLAPLDVPILGDESFTRASVDQPSFHNITEIPLARSHTISHLLQNVTTSAWVSDDYLVLPFWPAGYHETPLGASLGTLPQAWTVETTVFRTEMTCKPLTLSSRNVSTIPQQIISDGDSVNTTRDMRTITLHTDDGCQIQVGSDSDLAYLTSGSASWFKPGTYAEPVDGLGIGPMLVGSNTSDQLITYSQQCSDPEILLVMTVWYDDDLGHDNFNTFKLGGYSCGIDHFFASLPVTAQILGSQSNLIFDENDFRSKQRLVTSDLMDLTQFEDLFMSAVWGSYLVTPQSTLRPAGGGPAALLLAMDEFSLGAMINDTDIIGKATAMRQRYWGEMLLSLLSPLGGVHETTSGKISVTRTRLVVVRAVALVLEVIMAIEIAILCLIWWLTRPRLRQLGLRSDPALVATTAAQINGDAESLETFRLLHETTEMQRTAILRNARFKITNAHLSTDDKKDISKAVSAGHSSALSAKLDWRPFALHRWAIAGLGLFLVMILTAVLILAQISSSSGLYQQLFVYEANVTVSDTFITAITPFSIVPNVLAIGIGLWWGSMETEFRALQPFLAMTREPVNVSQGIELSYESSYLLYAVYKAIKRKHWLLGVICTGAFLSQVLTASMSALWQLGEASKISYSTLSRSLEPREIPTLTTSLQQHINQKFGPGAEGLVLSQLYGGLQTNWLYSATTAMTLNRSEPTWSHDGWSFVPVDLSVLRDGKSATLGPGNNTQTSSYAQELNGMTVTLTSPALRARLECSEYTELSNSSTWLSQQNLTDSSTWNTTANPDIGELAYTLGCDANGQYITVQTNSSGQSTCEANVVTSVFANTNRLTCCGNETEVGGNAAIGYWSQNIDVTEPSPFVLNLMANFSIKWIYGNPIAGLQKVDDDTTYLVWPTAPRIAALNCMAVVEKANASVTLDLASEQVLSYDILDDPVTDKEAFREWFLRRVDPSTETDPTDVLGQPTTSVNVTTSYGSLFVTALIRAAQLSAIGNTVNDRTESLDDLTFNFRQSGVNMDYISYSMYSQADQNAEALLDPKNLYSLANRTFATYFQHFVSFNVSLTNGSFAYQYINETLPADLGAVDESGNPTTSDPSPISYTNRTVVVQITRPVKVLQVSPIALWLSVGILIWLIVTTIVIVFVKKHLLAKLLKGTKTLADRAILVAGSDALLDHVADGHLSPQSDSKEIKTKLGLFRDKDGNARWGIELFGEGSGVEWLDEEVVEGKNRSLTTYPSNATSAATLTADTLTTDRTDSQKEGSTVTVPLLRTDDGQITTWI